MSNITFTSGPVKQGDGSSITAQFYSDPNHSGNEGPVAAIILQDGSFLGGASGVATVSVSSGSLVLGAGSASVGSVVQGTAAAVGGAWPFKITDGTNTVGLAQGRNADNQVPSGTAWQLDVASSGGVLNPCSNANGVNAGAVDRVRATAFDGAPAAGIPAGAAQFAVPFSTTLNNGGTVTGSSTPQTVTTLTTANMKVGDYVSVGGANPEVVYVSVVPSSTTFTAVFKNNHAATDPLTWFHYNVARDAGIGDAVALTGLSASMTYLWNKNANLGELDRSAAGELDGATGNGTAVAAEYEYNGGGPVTNAGFASGLAFDRARNLQGKGTGSATQSAGGGAGTTSITVSSATAVNTLQPGQQIRIDRGTGTEECAYVAQNYVPGTAAITLQSALQFTHTGATVEWDVFAPAGPGLNGFTASGVGIEAPCVYNPIDAKLYVPRSATADGVAGANVPAEAIALWNGATLDRNRSLGAGGDGTGVALAIQPSSAPTAATAGANTQVQVSWTGVGSQQHRLTMVGVSWSGSAPTTGLLTVLDGATTVLQVDVPLTLNTPYFVPLPPGGIKGSVSSGMTVTLSAGGAGAVGKLNVAKLTA